MSFIVIDKSWLQKTSTKELKSLTANNRILFPIVLFYEIITTEKESDLRTCFKKIIPVQHSVDLIEHVGSFLRYEWENNAPCTPIENQKLPIEFEFNSNLTLPNFPFTDDQKKHTEDLRDHWEISGSDEFKRISATVSDWFPELNEVKPGSSREKVRTIFERIANDVEFIRHIYGKCRLDYFPPTEILNQDWAHFRWIQLHLLAGVEYIRKYGSRNLITKNLGHDNLDLQYCQTGVLAGALATDDKVMKFFFQLCCPNGLLLSHV